MRETDTLDTEGIFRRYWSDLKIDLNNEGSQLYEKIVQLKLKLVKMESITEKNSYIK